MEESIAKSSEDHQRLLALKDNQQALLAEHFKNKVSISDPSVGKTINSYLYMYIS